MHTTWLLSYVSFTLLAQSQALALPSNISGITDDSQLVGLDQVHDRASEPSKRGIHYLPDDYHFSSADGWMTYQIRDVLDFSPSSPSNQTLYSHSRPYAGNEIQPREPKKSTKKAKTKTKAKTKAKAKAKVKTSAKSNASAISDAVGDALKGIGDAVGVIITW